MNGRIDELVRVIADYTAARPGSVCWQTAIDGLLLLRADHEKPPSHRIARPALCVVAQGGKWTSFGDERHHYQTGQALLVTVEMPSIGRVFRASADEPFLGVVVELSPAILWDVMAQLGEQVQVPAADARGATVIDMEPTLTDCVLRLVRVLERPEAVPVLAPLLMRELGYWLLSGPAAGHVAAMTFGHERSKGIMRAIHRLREEFAQPMRVAELAAEATLSLSSFHRQFKSITSLTPIQYQKQLRLLEARRLILTAHARVESAAYATGYASASQFSREYARMFGRSPRDDARAAGATQAGSGSAGHAPSPGRRVPGGHRLPGGVLRPSCADPDWVKKTRTWSTPLRGHCPSG
jgi:AraC-like DNA-binding protein